ncbi:MAG: outer membrane beta-barrel family protein [Muribaculaceae bacterium]|nr:outer membrane beta-barrel family protein [Muribaculaceae bacterium]
MKIRILQLLLTLLTGIMPAHASALIVSGRVIDGADNEDLTGATVRVLSMPDSAFVSAASAMKRVSRDGEEEVTSVFTVSIPSAASSYLLEISMAGYDKKYLTVNAAPGEGKTKRIDLPPIALMRTPHALGEVTVTSSRIKFFNRGDTVEFNADAFQVADGSMLDALVSQLPGVELRADGQIYYNGKYIESLLLDGKHFFNGDNQLMLENLGAYSVKDIKIYDRMGDASEFAGRDLGADKELVMDVRLKKEYSTGLIVNAEGGVGTDSRYLGRLFGMWFKTDTRLALYGSVNNLNDDRKPGRADSWSPADMKSGVSRVTTGGFDYSVDKKLSGIKAGGNIIVKHTDTKDYTATDRTNFLVGGDTYDRILRHSRLRNLSLVTKHNFYIKRRVFDLTVEPTVSYGRKNNRTTTAAITAAHYLGDISFGQLDDMSQSGSMLTDYINRYVDDNLLKGNTLTGGVTANSRIKTGGSANILRIGMNGNYTTFKDDRFSRYNLIYADEPDRSVSYDRYYRNHPNRNSNIGATVGYNMAVAEGVSLEVSYRYGYSRGRTTSELFNIDTDHPLSLGTLQSMSEFLSVLDRNNSYVSHTRTIGHTLSPFMVFERGNISGQINVPVTMSGSRLLYERGSIDTTIVRHTALVNVSNTFVQWRSPDKTKKVELMYDMTSDAPDLVNMVDMTDATDPLNIYEGNSVLRNSHRHSFNLSAEFMTPAKRLMQFVTVKYSFIDDALSKGYTYETATGIRRFRTYNVDGNREGSAAYGIGIQFGPRKSMSLQSLTTGSMVRSVDLVGDNDRAPVPSKVLSRGLNEVLRFSYGVGSHQIGLNADVTFRRYSGMASMSTWTHKYGVTGLINLTRDLQLSTDLSVFIRDGFADATLNSTDWVWNARLSYSMLKGRLVAMIDGFDMLHNLSNVTYAVNAQAKTETYTNVLPRYFMAHVQWRFNRQPKKKR